MTKKSIHNLVLAGVLCAVGIVVPMFMPKVILGPMSFTLASHVAIFLAMFISPAVAAAVCVGTTIGFFITTPFIIALRAATHIIFALIGATILKKFPETIHKTIPSFLFNFGMAIIHAVAEVAVVTPLFLTGSEQFKPEQLANGFVVSVLLLVGVGTIIHSMLDYSISILIWKPVQAVQKQNTSAA